MTPYMLYDRVDYDGKTAITIDGLIAVESGYGTTFQLAPEFNDEVFCGGNHLQYTWKAGDFVFKNFAINGSASEQTSSIGAMIHFHWISNVKLQGLVLYNGNAQGIAVSSRNGIIENCIVKGQATNGIKVDKSPNLKIRYNNVTN
jgi:hypothetical protein